MRQSLWVVNLSLLFLLCIGEIFFFFMSVSIPRRASLEPDAIKVYEKKKEIAVDPKKIYGVSDLFATFVPDVSDMVQEEKQVIPAIPDVPKMIPLSIPVEKQPVFIAPLPVTLKGIIYLHDDEYKSVAIIQMNDTKAEENYHVGDMILDAQIIKMFPNRIIVIRSGGQQETLYLRQDEVKSDLNKESDDQIGAIKIPHKDGIYYIPVKEFAEVVPNLGTFIDLLDITTVYRQGKVAGCRVGRGANILFAHKLGLQNNDIIVSIDKMPVTTLDSRVDIYDHLLQKNYLDSFDVEIERSGRKVFCTYSLVKTVHDITSRAGHTLQVKQSKDEENKQIDIEQEKIKILEHKIKMAPTAHQLEMAERQKMLNARNKKNMLSNLNL